MLDVLNGILFIIFCAILMVLLLDIQWKKISNKRKLYGGLVFAFGLGFNVFGILFLGTEAYSQYYMFFAQIPGFFLFMILSNYKGVKLLFVLLTTILLTPFSLYVPIVLRIFFSLDALTLIFIRVLLYLFTIYIVFKYLKQSFNYMLKHNDKMYWIFCLIPLLSVSVSYYIGRFNFTLSTNISTIPVRIFLFLIAYVSYYLVLTIFKSTVEKQMMQNEHTMMLLQLDSTKQYIDRLKKAREQAEIYRHDLRHHFLLIDTFMKEGNQIKAQEYINSVIKSIDEIIPVRHCKNDTVSLILSAFEAKSKEKGILLDIQASIPNSITVTDMEICSILSNALDNAIEAVDPIKEATKRKIRLLCCMQGEKLCIRISNPYMGEILFDNKLPQTTEVGHGLGVKSIVSIVKRHKGIYSFDAENGSFTLSLII